MLINFNHLKTFYNALVHKMKSFRGDWEQNDPTADDYIKNRTHYSEGMQEVTILSYKIDTDAQSATPMDSSGPMLYQIYFETSAAPLSEGQKYTVIWDKETYTCVAQELDSLMALGDPTLIGMSGNSTGEPFILAIDPEDSMGIIITTKAGKYPITVTTRQEVVHKLDKKYLPDDIDSVTSWDDLIDKPFHETIETIEPIVWDGNIDGLTKVHRGTTTGYFYKVSDRVFTNEQLRNMSYDVYMHGDTYRTNIYEENFDQLIESGYVTDDIAVIFDQIVVVRKAGIVDSKLRVYPEIGTYFVQVVNSNAVKTMEVSSLLTNGIVNTTVKTLDEKFIPDTIARTSDIAENYASKVDLDAMPTIHSGTTVPSNSLGKDGDIYIMYSNQ